MAPALNLSPPYTSRDTGQHMTCFDNCQLSMAAMFSISIQTCGFVPIALVPRLAALRAAGAPL